MVSGLAGTAIYQQRISHERLVRMDVAAGNRLVDEGDLFGALTWFVEALRLDQGNRDRERIDRLRIGSTLAQCPRLTQVWFHSRPVSWAEFSPDGRRVVEASKDGTARVWDATTGAPVTPVLRHGASISSARF